MSIRSGSQDGNLVGTLTNPSSLPGSFGRARFTAPDGGIDLAAATTYWVVLDSTSGSTITAIRFTSFRQ